MIKNKQYRNKKIKGRGLVSTKIAAELLGVSTSTIYRMVETGALKPSKTPGGQRRFDVVALEKYREQSKKFKAPQTPSKASTKPMKSKLNNDTAVITPVDKRNTLNDLNGTQWLPATKSYMFQKGLGSKHPHAKIERLHPAPYSFQDIEQLITFFTKKGMRVIDPFGGIGSTAKACELNDRYCMSIELQRKWNELAIERLETEVGVGASNKHDFITGDSRTIMRKLEDSSFDFMVTSPPYWSILNKKADHKVKKEDFFMECGRLLKHKGYMCLVVSDFRNKSKFLSFHSDIIQKMNKKYTSDGFQIMLQGVKVLLQNHKSLLPYGYPYAYVENIHHQYILIFRKMEGDKKDA